MDRKVIMALFSLMVVLIICIVGLLLYYIKMQNKDIHADGKLLVEKDAVINGKLITNGLVDNSIKKIKGSVKAGDVLPINLDFTDNTNIAIIELNMHNLTNNGGRILADLNGKSNMSESFNNQSTGCCPHYRNIPHVADLGNSNHRAFSTIKVYKSIDGKEPYVSIESIYKAFNSSGETFVQLFTVFSGTANSDNQLNIKPDVIDVAYSYTIKYE